MLSSGAVTIGRKVLAIVALAYPRSYALDLSRSDSSAARTNVVRADLFGSLPWVRSRIEEQRRLAKQLHDVVCSILPCWLHGMKRPFHDYHAIFVDGLLRDRRCAVERIFQDACIGLAPGVKDNVVWLRSFTTLFRPCCRVGCMDQKARSMTITR